MSNWRSDAPTDPSRVRPQQEPQALPVIVVSGGDTRVDLTGPAQVVGEDQRRISLKLKNRYTAMLLVCSPLNTSVVARLRPGAEFELRTTNEVFIKIDTESMTFATDLNGPQVAVVDWLQEVVQ